MTTQTPLPTGCPHYWKLPVADGPVSVGRCKYCGTTKEFRNSPDIVSRNPTNRPVRNVGYYPGGKEN